MRIILIDDDTDTHDFLVPYLEAEGFNVHSAYTGYTGLQLVKRNDPDLVILDVRLPQTDGWVICQRIRSFSSVPILMISAIAQRDEDIVYGLNIGADDYLTKPIRPRVLGARVSALLRRNSYVNRRNHRHAYIDYHLMIDLDRQQLRVQGERLSLSALEYRLLELLVRNADYPVPTLEIIEELWSETVGDDYARYVRIYIKRLREMIEPDPRNPRYIVTEHGFGYSFSPQV